MAITYVQSVILSPFPVILKESVPFVILRESAGRPKDLAVIEILHPPCILADSE